MLNGTTKSSKQTGLKSNKKDRKKIARDHLPPGRKTLIIRHKNEDINNGKNTHPATPAPYLFLQLKHHPKPSISIFIAADTLNGPPYTSWKYPRAKIKALLKEIIRKLKMTLSKD